MLFANFFHHVGKVVPRLWQSYAMPVTELCHAFGRTMPCLWQILQLGRRIPESTGHSIIVLPIYQIKSI
ncbi:hypothetical protein DXD68_08030 [Parabacteroides sp. TM07-1AC]|jgi:hypothetical protein|nr:hypothetical protein DXD68_08030 [Parabacteroides sp. TM07-1AC]